jgi:methylated-DNA-[protein]-cysteine S-methyltransferase
MEKAMRELTAFEAGNKFGTLQGFALFDTPIGRCALVWGGQGLVGALLPEANEAATRRRIAQRFPPVREALPPADVQRTITRVTALLNGVPGRLGVLDDLADVPIDLTGVPAFHRRVYAVARRIAPGATLTYGEVAQRLGDPHASRAVGQALGANPFPIIVPCHRVLAAGNRAGGFSADGGARTKLRLLQIEGAVLGGAPGLFDTPDR